MFENVDIQHIHTHILTTEANLYYKLTNEPKGSGELKMKVLSSQQNFHFVGLLKLLFAIASSVLIQSAENFMKPLPHRTNAIYKIS